MTDKKAIQERAYALWEKDACPEDAADFYWYLAQEQLEEAHARLIGTTSVNEAHSFEHRKDLDSDHNSVAG